jgi:indoleamine 2,3-dioxygenase
MPATPLTEILQDFRSYRPGNHREFLEWVQRRANDINLKDYALKDRKSAGGLPLRCSLCSDITSCIALYLHALNQVRDFRWRHWCFTREYILKRTSHPTATGGSPIVTVSFLIFHQYLTEPLEPQWLPNQLQAVLDLITQVYETYRQRGGLGKSCNDIMDKVYVQRDTLRKEVEKYCRERNVTV